MSSSAMGSTARPIDECAGRLVMKSSPGFHGEREAGPARHGSGALDSRVALLDDPPQPQHGLDYPRSTASRPAELSGGSTRRPAPGRERGGLRPSPLPRAVRATPGMATRSAMISSALMRPEIRPSRSACELLPGALEHRPAKTE